MLATIAAWSALMAQLEGNLFAFSPALDPWVALLKIATTVVCVGGTAAALWDARRGWGLRGWLSRGASLLLVAAFAVPAWLALVLKLASYSTDY